MAGIAQDNESCELSFYLVLSKFPTNIATKSQLSGSSTRKFPFSHDFSKQALERLQWYDVLYKELSQHILNACKLLSREMDEPWRAVSSVAWDGLQRWLGCVSAVGCVDFGPIQWAPQLGQLHPSVAAGSRTSCQFVHRPPVFCQEVWERNVNTEKLTAGVQVERRELKMFSRTKYRIQWRGATYLWQGTRFKLLTTFGVTNPAFWCLEASGMESE